MWWRWWWWWWSLRGNALGVVNVCHGKSGVHQPISTADMVVVAVVVVVVVVATEWI